MHQHYSLLALLVTQLMAVSMPGADFFVTVRQSLKWGRWLGVLTALGVTTGASVYCAATVFGLGWLKANASWLMSVIASVGSVYLFYMGWQCLFRANSPSLEVDTSRQQTLYPTPWKAYLTGLATNLSNPKVVVYYLSILPLFLANANSLTYRLVIFASLAGIALVWFVFVALLMGHNKVRSLTQRFMTIIEFLFGIMLWAFAGLLLWHFLLA